MGILRAIIQNAKNEGAQEAMQQQPIVSPAQEQAQPKHPEKTPAQPVVRQPQSPQPITQQVQPIAQPIQPTQPTIQAQPAQLNPNITPAWQQKQEPENPFKAVPDEEVTQPVAQPTISDRVSKGDNLYDILKEMGRPVDWEAEKKRAKRERSAALIGDLAGLLGNAGGLAAGSRQFAFKPQHTAKANERIYRLNDLERADNVDYFNKTLSTRMQDFKLNRAQEIEQAKINYRAYQDGLKNDQWGADFKIKVANLDRALKNDKITQDQWAKQFNETVKQHGVSNKIAGQNAATSARNANISEARLNYEKGNEHADKNQYIIGYGNEKFTYPKAAEGAISGRIYKLMQRETLKYPERYGDMDDINLKMGEGGDVSSKTAAIVKRRLVDFPQLKGQVQQIISQFDGGNQPSSNKPVSKPSTKKGSLLPH